MYNTCIFCRKPLGTNEVIETFPAGRRLRRLPLSLFRWAALAVLLAIVPFFLLVRGGVFAYRQWGRQRQVGGGAGRVRVAAPACSRC